MVQRRSEKREKNLRDGNTSKDLTSSPFQASAESASSIPSISLPKGGGAIKGIDEKFSVNPVTGTASLSIPIYATPGRSELYPKLSLDYDSGAGNGSFGLGWSLSIPSITRKTDNGSPRYQDAEDSDIYLLSGAEDLVPSLIQDKNGSWIREVNREDSPEYAVYRYRPRIEGLFSRIERWRHEQTGDTFWKSISRDNVTSIYGKSPASRIANPGDDSRVFKWLLEESRDDKGNVIIYEYKQENTENVDPFLPQEHNRIATNGSYANRYVKSIKYANIRPFEPGNWLLEVVFDYGEHDSENPDINESQPWPLRQDPFSGFRAGFEIRTQRLCRRVLMFHNFPELGDAPCLVRSTEFHYRETPILTYLTSTTQRGYGRDVQTGQYVSKALPPMEFTYTEANVDETVHAIDAESLENLPMGLDGTQYQWLDLDGEGIAGILTEQAGAWFYKRNLGNARFGPSQLVATKPSLGDLGAGQAHFMDLAGDGHKDLALLGKQVSGFYERNKESLWDSFVPFSGSPNIDWGDPNVRIVDLNGDGHADILITENDVFVWHPSRGEDGFGPAESVCKEIDEERGPALVFADATQSVYLADMSGDGLTDLVRIRNGEVSYWPNLGYGRFGAKVTMNGAPYFDSPDQFGQHRIRLADIDGSGTTDIIYLGASGPSFWFNQSGNSWSEPHSLSSFPAIDNLSSVTVVDLFGNGTACIAWSSPLSGNTSRPLCYVDLTGGQKPHLLRAAINNMGAETRLHYASSTEFYLEDLASGNPWITKLPFPVHVVKRVETREMVTNNKLVTMYKYHHGYFDGDDREFRGFGMVEQWDTESFALFNQEGLFDIPPFGVEERLHALPAYTKTWFHTGFSQDRSNISHQYIDDYYKGDPRAILLPDTVLPREELSAKAEHDACRALKGRILRQEIYGLDESAQSRHPYRVGEYNYQLSRIQPDQNGSHAVVYVQERETLDYYYERNRNDPDHPDPRISHRMILEVDNFGNVTKSASIGYPRRSHAFAEQGKTLITYTETAFINRSDDPTFYRIGVPYEVRLYEMTGIAPAGTDVLQLSEILTAAESAEEIPYEQEPTGSIQKRLIEHSRTLYYEHNFSGPLPLGEMDSLALPYRTYQVAFTPGLLTHVYGGRVTAEMLESEGKYISWDGAWWIPSGRQVFDADQFYLPTQSIDPFGQAFTTTYDPYALLVLQTEDPVNNVVTAINDYRTMSPRLTTGPNGNRSAVQFDELGMVVGTAVMGKKGENEGDTLEGFEPYLDEDTIMRHIRFPFDDPQAILAKATTRMLYDLGRLQREGKPAVVYTLTRETHDSDLAPGETTKIQHSFVYSDGLGREVMTKIQAEPGPAPERDPSTGALIMAGGKPKMVNTDPRWVGTGRTVYDNKGKPVKQYEPFFSDTQAYDEEAELVEWGVTPILQYDPLGRLIRTDNPNGTFCRVEFDPWQQTAWDENDTVAESRWYAERMQLTSTDPEHRAADLAAKHANTPDISHLDILGRTFLTIAKNTIMDSHGNVADIVDHHTSVRLDIRGNIVEIIDARGNRVMSCTYDLAGRRLYQDGTDNGERWILSNVADNPLRKWILNGTEDDPNPVSVETGITYDTLQRPRELFMRRGTEDERLVECTVYGEVHPDAEAFNLCCQPYQQYDGAGMVTNEEFDFKGNLRKSTRQLLRNYKDHVDWSLSPALEQETFMSSTTYDALSRPISFTTPDESVVQIRHNEASLLEKVDVWFRGSAQQYPAVNGLRDPATADFHAVTNINYNARGQRERIEYGNGACTDCTYDDKTFRLSHLETSRSPFSHDQEILQNLYYTYDPVGNITEIRDEAQQVVFFDNSVIEPSVKYEYDALYQLIRAEGREHIGQSSNDLPWHKPEHKPHYDFNDSTRMNLPHPNDGQAMRNYTENYDYDAVGNILTMIHLATNGGWTRRYEYANESNRLLSTSLPGDSDTGPYSANYTYDRCGNTVVMPHLRQMEWDFQGDLRMADRNGGGKAWYVYDAAGQRVRKVLENTNGVLQEERIYLGGFEVYRKHNGTPNPKLQREILHIMDDQKRVALVEAKTIDEGAVIPEPTPLLRYQFDNHLGSASLELDENGSIISYEEYYPYGGTSYQAVRVDVEVGLKRYRYTGKERDEESGFYYHGARYYAPWLGRWTSCDPVGLEDGTNLYVYVANRPIVYIDQKGFQRFPFPYTENDLQSYQKMSAKEQNAWFIGKMTEWADSKEKYIKERQKGIPESPRKELGYYYTERMREIDEMPWFLMIMPYASYAWQTMELIEGETITGIPIDRAEYAKGMAKGLAIDLAVGYAFGFLSSGPKPRPRVSAPRVNLAKPKLKPKPSISPSIQTGLLPERGPSTGISEIPRVPLPEPAESHMNYGTRAHQELPRIMSETNPGAQGTYNVAPGLTGPDFAPRSGFNATYGEMKSLWGKQAPMLRQARNWGFDPQTGRYFFYDRNTGRVFEGIIQTEKFPSGRFRPNPYHD